MNRISLLVIIACSCFFLCRCNNPKPDQSDDTKTAAFKSKIRHIIVIYQENWSFDGLYGHFPNANNLETAYRNDSMNMRQYDFSGNRLSVFPLPLNEENTRDTNFHVTVIPAYPYNLVNYINNNSLTGDIIHRFYTEQSQIDSGKMDKFVTWSTNGGLVQSYFDATDYPEGKLARQYTLCDNFFHSAYGGSFLNHIWLVSAAMPVWDTTTKPVPDALRIINKIDTGSHNQITTDNYAVNTTYSVNSPHPQDAFITADQLMPYLTNKTIGDLMIDAHVSWAWYSGGWTNAMESYKLKHCSVKDLFQFHHQPFTYFKTFKDSSTNKNDYLKDLNDFLPLLNDDKDTLRSVSFIKMYGEYNEHPGYADLIDGQKLVDTFIRKIMNSKYKDDVAIIIAYDENGGRWDHVSPPRKPDNWGCGTRVPAIVISNYAKKGFIDTTQYETVSILKFIETRFGLPHLSSRDSAANNLLNAFDFR